MLLLFTFPLAADAADADAAPVAGTGCCEFYKYSFKTLMPVLLLLLLLRV